MKFEGERRRYSGFFQVFAEKTGPTSSRLAVKGAMQFRGKQRFGSDLEYGRNKQMATGGGWRAIQTVGGEQALDQV